MIRGGPSAFRSEQIELFASHLIGTYSLGRTLQNVKTKEKLKVKMRVVLRTISLALFTAHKELVKKK